MYEIGWFCWSLWTSVCVSLGLYSITSTLFKYVIFKSASKTDKQQILCDKKDFVVLLIFHIYYSKGRLW